MKYHKMGKDQQSKTKQEFMFLWLLHESKSLYLEEKIFFLRNISEQQHFYNQPKQQINHVYLSPSAYTGTLLKTSEYTKKKIRP